MQNKYSSSFSFMDLLFNTLLGIMFILILALVLINPKIPPKQNAEVKGEYMLTFEWNHESKADFDIWIMDSNGNIVSYLEPKSGPMFLDIDDRGQTSSADLIVQPDGTAKYIELNREVIMLRGSPDGEYVVNVQYYERKNDEIEQYKMKINLISINPYSVKLSKDLTFMADEIKNEKTAFRFVIKNGALVSYDEIETPFIIEYQKRKIVP